MIRCNIEYLVSFELLLVHFIFDGTEFLLITTIVFTHKFLIVNFRNTSEVIAGCRSFLK